jgi:hypothetical protein
MKNSTRTNMMMGSIKALSLVGLGLGLMGNQSCQQQTAAPQVRQLKWYADAGSIKSPAVNFGDAGNFDFGYAASQQLYGVLYNSNSFAVSQTTTGLQPGTDGVELAGAQTMYKAMFGTKAVGAPLYYSDEARCLINLPDVTVSGSVISFAVTAGNGYSIGFNQSGAQAGIGLGAQYSVTTKSLQMQMYGVDSAKDLNGNAHYIAAPLVDQNAKDTSGKFDISYSLISAGYNWYKNTPLATMTEGALSTGVTKIKAEMDKNNWTTKVLDLQPFDPSSGAVLGDEGVVIKGGTDVNLKTGDQVVFYNEKVLWSGKPCESNYLGYARLVTVPFAYGEVAYASNYFSTIKITKRMDNTAIKPGWRVELYKRVEDVQAEAAAAAKAGSKGSGSSSSSTTTAH